jgi:hypothetical protein
MRLTLLVLAVVTFGSAQLCLAGSPATGASDSSGTLAPPRLSESDAIHIALAEAQRRKLDPRTLIAPRATFLRNASGGTWTVFLQAKEAMEDGCFWMRIDERTGKVDPNVQSCG